MVITNLKKSILSLMLLAHAGTLLPMAPAQEQGVFSALASDAVSLAKGIWYCLSGMAQGLGKTYLLAREYPKSALAIAAGIPLLGRWVYMNQYEKHIKPVVDRANNRLYSNWQISKWNNSAVLRKSLPNATNQFEAEFCQGQKVTQENVKALNEEIQNISKDMQELEDQYLVCRAPLGITLYDIRKEFADACKDKAELMLSEQDFNSAKETIKNEINQKIMPYVLFSMNYGQAAKAWLKLKIKQLRLQVLVARLNEIATGRAHDARLDVKLQDGHLGVHVTSSHDQA